MALSVRKDSSCYCFCLILIWIALGLASLSGTARAAMPLTPFATRASRNADTAALHSVFLDSAMIKTIGNGGSATSASGPFQWSGSPTPNKAPPSNQKWGQNALTSPEKNVIMYVTMAAIIAWLFAFCVAVSKLIKELFGWLREWRAKAPH
jgi:hypothetical protein